MIRVEILDKLLPEAKYIRENVFVKEQGFVNEFDETDKTANHMIVYEDDTPIACCRFFKGEDDEYVIGRLAVLKEHRGKHLGSLMLSNAEEYIKRQGGKKLSVSAQVRVKSFYEKQGYKAFGEIYLDEYCEHIHMVKEI